MEFKTTPRDCKAGFEPALYVHVVEQALPYFEGHGKLDLITDRMERLISMYEDARNYQSPHAVAYTSGIDRAYRRLGELLLSTSKTLSRLEALANKQPTRENPRTKNLYSTETIQNQV